MSNQAQNPNNKKEKNEKNDKKESKEGKDNQNYDLEERTAKFGQAIVSR